jgi:uncharacterized membrane protein YbhN (UPF0104 family)
VKSPFWRTIQVIAVVGVLVFVGLRIADQWTDLSTLPSNIHIDYALLAASGAAVLASYAVLIWTWQRMVRAWGEQIGFGVATRIWFVSNLGRYIPGKVWQIGAMGVMAQQAGVSAVAAVGSSLVIAIVNILAGFAVTFLAGATGIAAPPSFWLAGIVLTAGVIATPWLLPYFVRAASKLLRREFRVPALPVSAVWIAALGCAVAWVLYGLAFRWLHIALLGHATGDLAGSTSAFTLSYLAGYLFLLSPGGLGVREDVLYRLLGQFGIATGAEGWLVVLGSRLWLTVIEVLPGLLFLLVRRNAAASPSAPDA